MRRPPRLLSEDIEDIERLAAILGPAKRNEGAKTLLLLSYMPSPYAVKLEVLMARALQARGWKVAALTNAATAPMGRGYFGRLLGAELLRLEDYARLGKAPSLDEPMGLAATDLSAFKAWRYRGAPLALHALATVSSGRPDGAISLDAPTLRQLERQLRRSCILFDAAIALYAELRPRLALGIEKGFVGTCETFHAALLSGTDFVQWVGCHEPDAIMFKRYRPRNEREHPFSISDANWAKLRETPWRDEYSHAVMTEFERGYKTGAWFRYKSLDTARALVERSQLQARLGVDPAKKTAVIYSHILNDANLFYGIDLFTAGYEEWLVETVRAAAQNQRINWILKIHPANVVRNARLGYTGQYGELLALQRAFGHVPEFLRIVEPNDEVSPLSFFEVSDWGITVRGTVGVELPCFGVPVLTAGTGRYANKGFTVDSSTKTEYLEKIRNIDRIPPLTIEQRRLGLLYAYYLFNARPARYGEIFGDQYPMPSSHPRHRDLCLKVSSAHELFEHRQMQAIASFLEAGHGDDFLEAGRA